MEISWFFIMACIALGLWGLALFSALFGPDLEYKLVKPSQDPESPEFLNILEAVTDAKIRSHSKATVLTNGENFYPAQLEAIRNAAHSIHLEAYIFQRGKMAQQFLDALIERARAGVEVRLVVDGIGSFSTRIAYFRDFCAAGGHFCWYHPLRWHTLFRMNHRTHRELLIIDGKVGFIGGAGVADHWMHKKGKHPRWRDTVVRVEGEIVAGLQSTFLENWLEGTGEALAGTEYFQAPKATKSQAMVVNSTPSVGTSSRARMLFQLLLASAKESIAINSPYFLPDKSLRRALTNAVQRGVKVQIVLPGKKSDHTLTRTSSRRLYGDLLTAGVEIYEYMPTMIHAKVLIIDNRWSVVGSTNFDNRSFGLNDEVNLAACDKALAARLTEDFAQDIADSKRITYKEWARRPLWERMQELLGWVVQRQQ
ncbi:MAG TPA: cardiolipin synthase [Terriglobales bacterium]|nr:cardiolipin synthase [Terriglobales bacterium]